MDWTDQGIVLSARKHGESSIVLSLLTAAHGRHAGVVRGGQSRKRRGVMEVGNLLSVTWRARLEEHLGHYSVEMTVGHAARLLDRADRLAALCALCATTDACLAEREPHPETFTASLRLIEALDGDNWQAQYVAWELQLLATLGFGLDLTRCAATGTRDQLAYVSPRSARAVSRSAGAPYHDKLLTLPEFLTGQGDAGPRDIVDGLALTGYFLHRHVYQPHGRQMPDARTRLVELLHRDARRSLPNMA
jgi:DNA repair protein RecO (recombination protein O)